ncbi:MAG TPA: response regulator [Humibacter sp.]|nr:response regulator [Humibacter sp.]
MADGLLDRQNGRVFVSPDVIGMIIALFAFTVTVIGGVAGVLARFTKGLELRFEKIDTRFDRVDDRFDRVDERFDRMDQRIHRVEDELVEVKVAIARLEGPRPHLQRL